MNSEKLSTQNILLQERRVSPSAEGEMNGGPQMQGFSEEKWTCSRDCRGRVFYHQQGKKKKKQKLSG